MCAYVEVERSVDGVSGRYDGLRDDLAPKDTCRIVINPQRGIIYALAAHLSLPEGAAGP